MRTLLERFEEKFVPEPNSGCFLWTASGGPNGYGHINIGGKTVRAHRAAYELFKGPIPDNLCVLHTCDTPCCVNPGHLFAGTQTDNMTDMIKKGRARYLAGESHPRGTAKLTEKQVLEIRVATGSQKQIAARYGIGCSNVSQIKSRQRWGHL